MTQRGAAPQVTIRDVAREAGVSTSTVSRVLDERVPPARSAAAARVREVAARLGYRKDAYASALRRGGTSAVGVIVPRLTDTVMALLFEEIAAVCSRRSSFAVVGTTNEDAGQELAAVETLLAQRVDGLILATARLDSSVVADLRARGTRVVLALRTDGVSPSSVGDDVLGGYLATRHLLDLGHRRIALVAGPDYASSAQGRRAGFRKALAERGVDVDESLIRSSGFSMQAGEDVARALLGLRRPPTAVFAVNDNTAVGVLAAAQAMGLRVPADLSVVGYNDIPLSARLPVPLTTVRVPLDQIARAAVDLLDEDGGTSGRILTAPPSLIPRASTTSPR